MSVDELHAQIQDVILRLANVRTIINSAGQHVDEARSIGQAAFQGSAQVEGVRHAGGHSEALSALETACELLNRATRNLQSYVANRLGPSNVPGAPVPRSTPTPTEPGSSSPADVPGERVEQIRAELPPPVSPGTGQKTHGRLVANGKEIPIASGRDAMSEGATKELRAMGMPRPPARASDVEMKVAYWQRMSDTTHATVVINNVPCKGQYSCDELVPVLLPEGSTLTVHGQTASGVKFRKRYTGGKEPWWS